MNLALSQLTNRLRFFGKAQKTVGYKGLNCVFGERGLKMWRDVVLKKGEAW